jgi:hypothetical protein
MIFSGSKNIFPTKIWAFNIDNTETVQDFTNILYNMAESHGEGRRGG